jgi:uncharacterized protein with HEPN domain
MSRDPQLRLADIVEACARIADYIKGLDAAAFEHDPKTQDAVIRQFEIIGEAVKGLPRDLTAQDPSTRGRRLRAFAMCSLMLILRLIPRSFGMLHRRRRQL